MQRGVARLLAGDPGGAVRGFDLALDLDPALHEARFNRGVASLSLRRWSAAANDFAKVYADSKELRATAAVHNALALDGAGRAAEAESWIGKALAADPALDAALLLKGFLLERRGELQAAGKVYRQYLERHPDSAIAMLRFGISAQRAGFAETGKSYLQRVIATAPDSSEAVEARKFLVMWE